MNCPGASRRSPSPLGSVGTYVCTYLIGSMNVRKDSMMTVRREKEDAMNTIRCCVKRHVTNSKSKSKSKSKS